MDEEDLLDISILLAFVISLVACIVNSFLREKKIYCYKDKNVDYIEV
jgi:cytochrome c biogenesis protein ResB